MVCDVVRVLSRSHWSSMLLQDKRLHERVSLQVTTYTRLYFVLFDQGSARVHDKLMLSRL